MLTLLMLHAAILSARVISLLFWLCMLIVDRLVSAFLGWRKLYSGAGIG
ncbi:MAG: hypothetical protein ACTXOO_05040 [Sodalis sp. (in: enterobacteria)]